ncbi:MAG: response regulator [Syntrophobacteraceae bacterium]|nr:response regulator [Syntrophobacteraceae bacterium]
MGESLEILILDDESIVGQRLKSALEKEGYSVEAFVRSSEAATRLLEKNFDIVVTDIRMEGMDGMQLLERVKRKSPETKVIIITGYASLELAREAAGKGAFDFIAKPFRIGTMRDKITKAAKALEKERAAVGN